MSFREVIMGWKNIDNLHMGPPSSKQRVRNEDKVYPRKEATESNIETKEKNTGGKILYADIVIHNNIRRHDVGTEISCDHQYRNYDIRPNLCSSNDSVSTWSFHKPYHMRDVAMTKVHTQSWSSDNICIGC